MQQKSEVIYLRAHHLICINTFSGLGYSDAFINNMARIVEALNSPSQPLRIIDRLDDICAFCCHSNGRQCLKNGKLVLEMDNKVKEILQIDLSADKIYTAGFLNKKVERAMKKGFFCKVCKDCEWFTICRQLLKCNG
ncbi:MAG: DUF1284 domain-containing protein [Actinomycetota bacterium]